MKVNYCPKCGSKLSPDNVFCGACGYKIKAEEDQTATHKECTTCGYTTTGDEKFCPECGKALSEVTHNEISRTSKSKSTQKKKTTPTTKLPDGPPAQKKKRGILRTLGKLALWVFAILIVSVVALYYIGDSVESSETLDPIGQINDGGYQIEIPEKVIFKDRKTISEGILYPENARLASSDGGIVMSFDPLCFDEPIKGTITKLHVENPPQNTILNIYDFKLESIEELGGIATLEIPYDASEIPNGMTAAQCVTGVYYHEDLHEWIEETSTIDEDRQVIYVTTTHLSAHGSMISLTKDQEVISDKLIKRTGKGAPYERAMPLKVENFVDKLSKEDMTKITNSMSTFGAGDANGILSDASLKFLGDGGSFLGIGNDFLKLNTYSESLTKKISTKLGKFGGALIAAQFVSDVYFDRPGGVILFNSAKGLFFLGAGIVGGPVTVVLAAVFLLDVSGIAPIGIPLYKNEVYHRTAVKAYDLYYSEHGNSDHEWMALIQFLIKDVSEERLTGDAFNKRYIKLLKESVIDYTEKFFNEDPKVITEYMERAFGEVKGYLGKKSFFGYGRVYNETDFAQNKKYVEEYVQEILDGSYNGTLTSLRDEIQGKYNEELLKETIPKIMKMKSEQQYLKQLEYLRVSQQELIQTLNTTFSLYFIDRSVVSGDKSKYDSYYLAPIIKDHKSFNEYRPEKWIIQLNDEGKGSLDMKLLAHYRAMYFTTFGLYKKNDYQGIINGSAKPIKTIDIGTISSNNHYINISSGDASILIEGPRFTNIELPEGESVTRSFTAVSEYQKACYIVWSIGESARYKKEGNKSEVTHEFKELAKYQITATLYDQDGTKLSMDIVNLEILEGEIENHLDLNNCRNREFHLSTSQEDIDLILMTPEDLYLEAETSIKKELNESQKEAILRAIQKDFIKHDDYYRNILEPQCYEAVKRFDLWPIWHGDHTDHNTGKSTVYYKGYLKEKEINHNISSNYTFNNSGESLFTPFMPFGFGRKEFEEGCNYNDPQPLMASFKFSSNISATIIGDEVIEKKESMLILDTNNPLTLKLNSSASITEGKRTELEYGNAIYDQEYAIAGYKINVNGEEQLSSNGSFKLPQGTSLISVSMLISTSGTCTFKAVHSSKVCKDLVYQYDTSEVKEVKIGGFVIHTNGAPNSTGGNNTLGANNKSK